MSIEVKDLGYLSYEKSLSLQKQLKNDRIKCKRGDIVLLVEHDNVYTLGKNAKYEHILTPEQKGAKIINTDRGGGVTYHGPGQLVVYPIINLNNYQTSVNWYMNCLQDIIINTLAEFSIKASNKTEYIGVWVDDKKIAALGVRISNWTTMHGFALNVNTDLNYYKGIIPCGITEFGVTSMKQLLGENVDMGHVKKIIINNLKTIFNL